MLTEQDRVEARTSISRAELEELVHSATLAPSPDNNQPWLFEVSADGGFLLCHDHSRSLPSDVDHMFSMIALGAALENLLIAATHHGWEPQVEYLAHRLTKDKEAVASVRFRPGGRPDPLYAFLARRVTCRKRYRCGPVSQPMLRTLEEALASHEGIALHWASERTAIRSLAWLVAATDRMRFEYQSFHEELYRQLRFSPQEAELTRDGLDLRCLEVPRLGAALLRWLRPWPRMRSLNRFGLSRLLSFPSVLVTWNTGTMGLLSTEVTTREGYLRAGRALERVWLTATKLGLAFHPLGSLPIYLSRLARQAGEGLTPGHQRSLERIARTFFQIFPKAKDQGLVLLFRLGEAPKPHTRSLRRSVSSVFDACCWKTGVWEDKETRRRGDKEIPDPRSPIPDP